MAMAAPESNRLFVTKVPPSATRDDLATYFSRFGTTTDVYVPTVPGKPGHKGIAFIAYADPAAVQEVMSSGAHEIAGQPVVVDIATARGEKPARPMAGQAGGYPAPMPQWQLQPQWQAPSPQPQWQPQRPPVPRPEEAGGRLFVTKIPPELRKEQVQEHFAQFGEMTDVYMPGVPGSNSHKGICFVSYQDPAALQMALGHAAHEIGGHPVVVDVATPRGSGAAGAIRPPAGAGWGAPPAGYGGYVAAPQPRFPGAPGGYNRPPPAYGAYGASAPGYGATAPAYSGYPGMAPRPPQGGLGGRPPLQLPQAGRAGTPVPGRLFVTRVAPDMTKNDLQQYFQQFGELKDVFVPNGKGIAFVSYNDQAICETILQEREHFVRPGEAVLVDQAIDRPPLGGLTTAARPTRYSPY